MKFTRKLFTVGLVAGSALGTLTVVNKLTEKRAGELNTVLTGEERRFTWKYGDMFYETKGHHDARALASLIVLQLTTPMKPTPI